MRERALTPEQLSLLDEPIQVLGLTDRTMNALEKMTHPPAVRTIGDLLQCRPEVLLQSANIGNKSMEEIYGALECRGFFRPAREHLRTAQQEAEAKRAQERRFMLGF